MSAAPFHLGIVGRARRFCLFCGDHGEHLQTKMPLLLPALPGQLAGICGTCTVTAARQLAALLDDADYGPWFDEHHAINQVNGGAPRAPTGIGK